VPLHRVSASKSTEIVTAHFAPPAHVIAASSYRFSAARRFNRNRIRVRTPASARGTHRCTAHAELLRDLCLHEALAHDVLTGDDRISDRLVREVGELLARARASVAA
jgi:hypothetical protein